MKVEDESEGIYHDCYLLDDGTLDTVIEVDGHEFRFEAEYASIYRDEDGILTKEGFIELCQDCFFAIRV